MIKYRVILRETGEVYFETSSLIALESVEQTLMKLKTAYYVES